MVTAIKCYSNLLSVQNHQLSIQRNKKGKLEGRQSLSILHIHEDGGVLGRWGGGDGECHVSWPIHCCSLPNPNRLKCAVSNFSRFPLLWNTISVPTLSSPFRDPHVPPRFTLRFLSLSPPTVILLKLHCDCRGVAVTFELELRYFFFG